MRIDLHAHSTASDGVDTPAQLVRAAAAAGLDVVAITDHDTVAGWDAAAAEADRAGVVLVRGVEVSCHADGISVHLLSYLNDPADQALLAELTRSRDDRVARARRMTERISADYPVTWDQVQQQVPPGATVGRPHIADAMVAAGVVRSRDEVFGTVLHRESPYYVSHYSPDAVTAVRLVRGAGGVPVMAHPMASRRGRIVSDQVIAGLADAGLAGLEVDHPDHAPHERAHLRGLAAELGLLATGSSDYHGDGRPNVLGCCTTAPEDYRAVVEQGRVGLAGRGVS